MPPVPLKGCSSASSFFIVSSVFLNFVHLSDPLETMVFLIPKRRDSPDPNHYRPIFLTYAILNAFVTVISDHLSNAKDYWATVNADSDLVVQPVIYGPLPNILLRIDV